MHLSPYRRLLTFLLVCLLVLSAQGGTCPGAAETEPRGRPRGRPPPQRQRRESQGNGFIPHFHPLILRHHASFSSHGVCVLPFGACPRSNALMRLLITGREHVCVFGQFGVRHDDRGRAGRDGRGAGRRHRQGACLPIPRPYLIPQLGPYLNPCLNKVKRPALSRQQPSLAVPTLTHTHKPFPLSHLVARRHRRCDCRRTGRPAR